MSTIPTCKIKMVRSFLDMVRIYSMSEKRIVKVQISIPNEGHTECEAYANRLLMCFHLGMLQLASKLGVKEYEGIKFDYPDDVVFEFIWSTVGRVLTPIARERLTEWAIAGGVDYIFMIDDDMICPMDLFEKLFKHNVDVVAPLAFTRRAPHYPVIYRVLEGYDNMTHQAYFVNKQINNYPKDTLVECDAVGFGAALIKMDVIKKMTRPYFMSTTAAGEDIWFCRQAKRSGARIYMDTATKLGHMGMAPIITEVDYEREFKTDEYRKEQGEYKAKEKGENNV